MIFVNMMSCLLYPIVLWSVGRTWQLNINLRKVTYWSHSLEEYVAKDDVLKYLLHQLIFYQKLHINTLKVSITFINVGPKSKQKIILLQFAVLSVFQFVSVLLPQVVVH